MTSLLQNVIFVSGFQCGAYSKSYYSRTTLIAGKSGGFVTESDSNSGKLNSSNTYMLC